MGFFGLFGNKTKYVDEPNTVENSSQNKEAYYLSNDDAKSLGDPERIRKSMKKETTSKANQNGTGSVTPTPKKNRSVDTNMDIFRKMAKDIKK